MTLSFGNEPCFQRITLCKVCANIFLFFSKIVSYFCIVKQKIKDILFDLDGTLTDSQEGITNCLAYALEKSGHPPLSKAELLRYVGPPLWDTLTSLVGAAQVRAAYDAYIDRFQTQGKGIAENAVYPGIPETLAALGRAGKRLFVATSKPETTARQILDAFHLSPFFTGIHGALWDGVRREKSAVIAYVCETHALTPATTIMIGDRSHDIEGATENALRAVGVLWGYGSQEELEKAGAFALARTPQDLIPLLP